MYQLCYVFSGMKRFSERTNREILQPNMELRRLRMLNFGRRDHPSSVCLCRQARPIVLM